MLLCKRHVALCFQWICFPCYFVCVLCLALALQKDSARVEVSGQTLTMFGILFMDRVSIVILSISIIIN